MRFTCEKSMLMNGLNITGRVVAQKSASSAIEGILCKCSVGMTLTGYNMETAITYMVEADVSESGACILPAKLFSDIIRRLPEGPVTVVVDEQYKISVRAGYSNFNISGEAPDDYPDLPDIGDSHCVYLNQKILKELIGGTIFAVAENQGRPIHTGVKFELEDDTIAAIAVDGFRLARRCCSLGEKTNKNISFVVPAHSLKEVEKILMDDEDQKVSFLLGNRHILFQLGGATLICRLLEGDFLDWRKVVPTDCPVKLVANVADFSASIERVGLLISEKYKSPVRCLFSDQVVHLCTSNTLGAAEDRCTVAGDGKDLEIGFNARYLTEALRAVPDEEVVLELTNGLSPIVMTPVEGSKDQYSYMVLPVRIKTN